MSDLNANSSNVGQLAFKTADELNIDINLYESNFTSQTKFPVICVKRRQKFLWVEISDLSKNDLHQNKFVLHDILFNIYNTNEQLEKQCSKYKKELTTILNYMDKSNLVKILKQERLKILKNWCPICVTFQEQGIKKCMHTLSCTGACENCFSITKKGNVEVCNACGSEQHLTCPTCYQEKTLEQLCKSNNCSHYICWECRGRSCRAGKEIYKCPQCRAKLD